jgi:dihydrodipicolinate synthase/N-acetylneuraminate lyase
MRILRKALAIDASIPIISNSISSSVRRFISILKFLQNFSADTLLSTPEAANEPEDWKP